MILFFIFYGVTGTVALIAALYLLLRRGNAFAPDVAPPPRLRRWAAAFFAVAALGHVWWYLFFVLSGQPHSADEAMPSAWYAAINVLDCVTLLTTLSGTLLAMLQDRRRPVWPVVATLLPFVVLSVVLMLRLSQNIMYVCFAYLLAVYVAFTLYMIVAVRQYGRWLRDNFADLERKEVSLSYAVALASMLLIICYALIDSSIALFFSSTSSSLSSLSSCCGAWRRCPSWTTTAPPPTASLSTTRPPRAPLQATTPSPPSGTSWTSTVWPPGSTCSTT